LGGPLFLNRPPFRLRTLSSYPIFISPQYESLSVQSVSLRCYRPHVVTTMTTTTMMHCEDNHLTCVTVVRLAFVRTPSFLPPSSSLFFFIAPYIHPYLSTLHGWNIRPKSSPESRRGASSCKVPEMAAKGSVCCWGVKIEKQCVSKTISYPAAA
jgi:hypothetical protein